MASIPWWAWLGVGVFVAVSSSFVSSLRLFVWVGLIFIVVVLILDFK